mgnify:CR=1 FL=1
MTEVIILSVSGLILLGAIAQGVIHEILLPRSQSRIRWANAAVERLLRASGRYHGHPDYQQGVRVFVEEDLGGTTIRIGSEFGQVDPGGPDPLVCAAITAIGDAAKLKPRRHYDFAVKDLPRSATLRAAARTRSRQDILDIGLEVGNGQVHPAFAALADADQTTNALIREVP